MAFRRLSSLLVGHNDRDDDDHYHHHEPRQAAPEIMEGLVEKMNEIQDLFSTLGYDPIELPKIVVVGQQSAGKSSVLESLVKRPFLPRGSGMVTRCPLVLQLNHCPADDRRRKLRGTKDVEEWGEFLHAGQRVFNLDEIEEEISEQTVRLAGSNKSICSRPITLKVFSPHVVNITLVDLPGLTKVAIEDQPADIEDQIRDLVYHYIKNPNSIILALVMANVDMATNESLKLAREVDPEGRRTLAVVTKLDLMDKGTDAYQILQGRVIPVKLGIIGVVNRSQADIDEAKSIDDSLADEEEFFRDNYPELSSRNGSRYLAVELKNLLINHIQDCLPKVQEKIQQQIQECEENINICGTEVKNTKVTIVDIIYKFTNNFCSMLEGGCLDIKDPAMLGGAKIRFILHNQLDQRLSSVRPCDKYTLEEVILIIRKSNGPRPPFFASEQAFEALVLPLIEDIKKPALQCVRRVHEELLKVCEASLPKEVSKRFPYLKKEISTVVREIVEECAEVTEQKIKDLFAIEKSHLTYNRIASCSDKSAQTPLSHAPDQSDCVELPFKRDGRGLAEVAESLSRNLVLDDAAARHAEPGWRRGLSRGEELSPEEGLLSISEMDRHHVLMLGTMLAEYYKMVSESLQDSVAKTNICFLVKEVKSLLQRRLTLHFFEDDLYTRLFVENKSVATSRQQNQEKLEALTQALRIVEGIFEDN